ncbi:hypothetical protein C6347_03495 [Bacillus sp. NMTD17]|nr:hypothetical protein C6347_03495 [Bacillus sp. NMTD17]
MFEIKIHIERREIMQTTYNFKSLEPMLNFALSYIHEKGFTFTERVTLTGENDPGQLMEISFGKKYNNVSSEFVLKYGTQDEIIMQLEEKMLELKEIRVTVEELKSLLGA